MDQIQQLSTDTGSILATNDTYTAYRSQWRYLLESYLGGEEYRNAGHLVRYQLEQDREYQSRLAQTPLDNHCSSVISVYNSFLFREEPQRDLGSIQNLPETEQFINDTDLDGRQLNSFVKDVATWASVFGHAWVLVVKPNTGARTLAEERQMGARPYAIYLTPLAVMDWQYGRDISGRYQLEYFKYLEESTGSVRVVKEWTRDSVKTSIIDVEHDTVQQQHTEPNSLGKIPAVCVYNRKGVVRGIGVSDIADIADKQKFIYNATSEIMQSIQMDTHPSLVATPETNVGTGSGALIHMPENTDPGLKPYLLEFSGAGVDSILKSIQQEISAIDKMANTGAVRATESRTMSGVAMQTEFQLLNARLSEKARNLELAEEQIWRLFSEYMGTQYTGRISYPGSFNITDQRDSIEQLRIAREIVGEDDPALAQQIYSELATILDMEPTMQGETASAPAEGFRPHLMQDPQTGETVLAETREQHLALQAQGYIHP